MRLLIRPQLNCTKPDAPAGFTAFTGRPISQHSEPSAWRPDVLRRRVHVSDPGLLAAQDNVAIPTKITSRVRRASRLRRHGSGSKSPARWLAGRRDSGSSCAQFALNSDTWTAGAIYLWGACWQQGNDPKNGYARTWASQTAVVAAGIACGGVVISAKDNVESPSRAYGPGSNLADNLLFAVNGAGEVTIAGGTGNGYRLSQLRSAVNPNGWSGVIEVQNPAGVTAGYILLYTNP